MKYTFEIQWPLPFNQEWKRSGQRLDTLASAADEMVKFMIVSFENGAQIAGRLIELPE